MVLKDDLNKLAESWSPDGQFVLYWLNRPGTNGDLWVLPLSGTRAPRPVRVTPFAEGAPARFSPDGRWIAYWSDESGRSEVYVTDFPESSERWQVSTNGGDWPRWSADGRELFYLRGDNTLMAVPADGRGRAFAFGTAQPLFALRPRAEDNDMRYPYDVAPDGRFLISALVEPQAAQTITLLVNWPSVTSQPSSP